MALLLALARNIPQAYMSLTAGKWERSKFSGVELYEKTLGIVGFGRIGQLVAARARGFGMRVIAFDPFVSAERYRELGVEKAENSEEIYAQADFITIHLPKTPETQNWLNAEAFAQMRDGVRILNVARGGLIDEAALKDALDSGKVGGAALDVFPSEPMTEHPLFGYPNVIVTPHLGASTAEATDRAGYQSAEQVVAALTGGVVSTAVNIPSIGAEDMEVLGPFLPLAHAAGAPGDGARRGQLGRAHRGGLHGPHRGLRHAPADARGDPGRLAGPHRGAGQPRQRALDGRGARDRRRGEVGHRGAGLQRADPRHRDRGRASASRSPGPASARNRVPHLVEVQGRRLTVELEPFVTVFRYADLPGMIGRVGTIFGSARHQHLLGRGRTHARWRDARRRRGAAPGGDGRHDRRAVPARGRRGDRRLRGLRGRLGCRASAVGQAAGLIG